MRFSARPRAFSPLPPEFGGMRKIFILSQIHLWSM